MQRLELRTGKQQEKNHKSFFPFAIVTPTAGSKDEREGRFQHLR
jgi:hypothetical protein